MILSNGYATGYSPGRVRQRAEFAAKAITALSRYTGATAVVVHGNSGVSCGFAALMVTDTPFNLALLRKDNDNSHGAPIEGPEGHKLAGYLILDDFVSSGATLNRVRDKINKLHRAGGVGFAPECLGIVLYNHHILISHIGQMIELLVYEDNIPTMIIGLHRCSNNTRNLYKR